MSASPVGDLAFLILPVYPPLSLPLLPPPHPLSGDTSPYPSFVLRSLGYETLILGGVFETSQPVRLASSKPMQQLQAHPFGTNVLALPSDAAAVNVSREATTLTEVFSRVPLPSPQVGCTFLEILCCIVH